MLEDKKRVLILAPHVDDGEYGCGGIIHKYSKQVEFFYVSFSFAEQSLISEYTKLDVAKELRSATKLLGIKSSNIISKDYEVRKFNEYRQDILENLVKLKRDIGPDLVFLPSTYDIHQDHQVICNEGMRAFKNISILGYEMIRNNFLFKPGHFCILSPENIDKKVKAIQCYKSQVIKRENSVDFVYHQAKMRGTQVDTEFAESFETIRWII